MTLLDSVILFAVLVSALIGVVRGFLREMLSIASWVLAIFAAFTWHDAVADDYLGFVADAGLRRLAAFSVVLVVTLVAATLLSQLVRHLVSATGLMPVDRLLGFLFGLLRGAFIVAVVVVLAADTTLPRERWWRDSLLVDGFEEGGRSLVALLPDRIARHMGDR